MFSLKNIGTTKTCRNGTKNRYSGLAESHNVFTPILSAELETLSSLLNILASLQSNI